MTIRCPACKNELNVEPAAYVCPACRWKINKVHAGKTITPEIINELAANGQTGLLENFIAKTGKPFKAALAITARGVGFVFENQIQEKPREQSAPGPPQAGKKSATIRVESPSPGVVQLNIYGERKFDALINFGLYPARISEALGVIIGARYLQHYGYKKQIVISANEKTFVEYALREKNPRSKEAQTVIETLWDALKPFDSWEMKLAHRKSIKLKGGLTTSAFPRGIFPGMQARVDINGSSLFVNLPDRFEVQAQFMASFGNAHQKGTTFSLPAAAERAVKAWLNSVTAA